MRILPTVGFPDKPSVHWEYWNPKEPLEMLPLIPRMDKPHVVLNGQIKQECNYGPNRNLWQKWKWAAKKEQEKDVDHSQTSSVAKALGILRERWDREGIQVANFMIDCQHSEENAIWGVFPESCVYLCGFHRLQAWLLSWGHKEQRAWSLVRCGLLANVSAGVSVTTACLSGGKWLLYIAALWP